MTLRPVWIRISHCFTKMLCVWGQVWIFSALKSLLNKQPKDVKREIKGECIWKAGKEQLQLSALPLLKVSDRMNNLHGFLCSSCRHKAHWMHLDRLFLIHVQIITFANKISNEKVHKYAFVVIICFIWCKNQTSIQTEMQLRKVNSQWVHKASVHSCQLYSLSRNKIRPFACSELCRE